MYNIYFIIITYKNIDLFKNIIKIFIKYKDKL